MSIHRVDISAVTDAEAFAAHIQSAVGGDAVVFAVRDDPDGNGRVRTTDVAVLIPMEAWVAINRLIERVMQVPLTCFEIPLPDMLSVGQVIFEAVDIGRER